MLKFNMLIKLYAKSVFDFALKNQTLDSWQNMLMFMTEMSCKKEIKYIINNMSFLQQLGDFFISICGDRLDKHGQNFVRIIAEYNRLIIIGNISQEFVKLRQQHENIIHVILTSAYSLSQEIINSIVLVLEQKLKKRIYIKNNIDIYLIDGFIIQFNDTVIDLSVRSRLNCLAYFLQH